MAELEAFRAGKRDLQGRAKEGRAGRGVRLKKRYGQHLLVDRHYLRRIVEAAEVGPGDVVVEIGPGTGNLTAELAERAALVLAIELDRDLETALAALAEKRGNVRLTWADARRVDLDALVEKEAGAAVPYKVAANLPYYISTPLILKLVCSGYRIQVLALTVQREVARRLVATPGSKDYGALSVAVQHVAEARLVDTIPAGAFFPPPRVASAVVQLRPLPRPAAAVPDEELFRRVVRAAFGRRRKTLLNSLAGGGLGPPRAEWPALLARAGVSPGARAEELSQQDFAAVAWALFRWAEGQKGGIPGAVCQSQQG